MLMTNRKLPEVWERYFVSLRYVLVSDNFAYNIILKNLFTQILYLGMNIFIILRSLNI